MDRFAYAAAADDDDDIEWEAGSPSFPSTAAAPIEVVAFEAAVLCCCASTPQRIFTKRPIVSSFQIPCPSLLRELSQAALAEARSRGLLFLFVAVMQVAEAA
jgi:hypothetical protein